MYHSVQELQDRRGGVDEALPQLCKQKLGMCLGRAKGPCTVFAKNADRLFFVPACCCVKVSRERNSAVDTCFACSGAHGDTERAMMSALRAMLSSHADCWWMLTQVPLREGAGYRPVYVDVVLVHHTGRKCVAVELDGSSHERPFKSDKTATQAARHLAKLRHRKVALCAEYGLQFVVCGPDNVRDVLMHLDVM